MKIQNFLERHGIRLNPFADEDAQSDKVFKEHCLETTRHVAWDKILGDPADPATSVVFGEKGAGKTALRLQLAAELDEYSRRHPQARVFVVEYDDFNPFLDHFRDSLPARQRRSDKALAQWKLWDHMDAILALAVTQLADRILRPAEGEALPIAALDHWQRRDLLLLAACYDQSQAESIKGRWRRLRKALRYPTWRAWWDLALGAGGTLLVAGVIAVSQNWGWLASVWPYLFAAAAWAPRAWRSWKCHLRARGVKRQVRTVTHDTRSLRQIFLQFPVDEFAGQPLPSKDRTDDRYELLGKLQGALKTLGYSAGVMVLVDRVDEPHLVNGAADQMRALVWPLLDNKLLKQPGLGFKLLLPIELAHYIDREDRDFYQRARLDKQNVVPSLVWTPEALYDVAVARLRFCARAGETPTLKGLFQETISERRLMDAFRQLRVPRHVFKFLYRLLVAHCNAHTDDSPVWQIASETFESVLALYVQEQDAFDRGVGPGS